MKRNIHTHSRRSAPTRSILSTFSKTVEFNCSLSLIAPQKKCSNPVQKSESYIEHETFKLSHWEHCDDWPQITDCLGKVYMDESICLTNSRSECGKQLIAVHFSNDKRYTGHFLRSLSEWESKADFICA